MIATGRQYHVTCRLSPALPRFSRQPLTFPGQTALAGHLVHHYSLILLQASASLEDLLLAGSIVYRAQVLESSSRPLQTHRSGPARRSTWVPTTAAIGTFYGLRDASHTTVRHSARAGSTIDLDYGLTRLLDRPDSSSSPSAGRSPPPALPFIAICISPSAIHPTTDQQRSPGLHPSSSH